MKKDNVDRFSFIPRLGIVYILMLFTLPQWPVWLHLNDITPIGVVIPTVIGATIAVVIVADVCWLVTIDYLFPAVSALVAVWRRRYARN